MFSALKRLARRQNDTKTASPFPSGVASIGEAMQKKFAKGVHYNMKIVIKGDRNTGKTCLFQRLQGKPFNEAYMPTQAIQAASINWNYRGQDSIVKVDVWDIVDKGQKKQNQDSLKISNEPKKTNTESNMHPDADSIDVFKGTHGVIMLLDITKPWTLLYVERELPRVPNHIPVLVLANRKDMSEHQLVDADRVIAFIEHLDRPVGSAEVNFAESSMKDGFGLQYLYRFLNIPFLILQRESLLRQLEANALEIEDTREALLCNKDTEEQNYELFKQALQRKKGITSSGAVSPSSETDETASETSPNVSRKEEISRPSPEVSASPLPPANIRQSAVSSASMVAQGRNYSASVERKTQGSSQITTNSGDIHEFSPEDDLDPSFLSEEKQKRWWKRHGNKKPAEIDHNTYSNDESDEEGGNPLVAAYHDLDSEDEQPAAVLYKSDTLETENHSDIDEESSDAETDEHSGPKSLVTQPIDDVITDFQYEPKPFATTEPTPENEISIDKTENDDGEIDPEEVSDALNKQSSDGDDDDDGECSTQYQVTADLELEDPVLDNWLDDDHATTQQRNEDAKDKEGDSKKNSADVDAPRHPSFTIAADELDIFVTEQLRKGSLSPASEDEEVKKPKKKKEKKKGEDGAKKKKKKSAKETIKTEGIEQERKTKKTKIKDGKKKTTPKRTTESEDYELI